MASYFYQCVRYAQWLLRHARTALRFLDEVRLHIPALPFGCAIKNSFLKDVAAIHSDTDTESNHIPGEERVLLHKGIGTVARLRNRRPRNGSSLPDTDIFLFFRDSRLSLGPIQFPNRRILPRGKVATHLHIAPTLRIRGVIPLLPHTFMAWTGTTLVSVICTNCLPYETSFFVIVIPALPDPNSSQATNRWTSKNG